MKLGNICDSDVARVGRDIFMKMRHYIHYARDVKVSDFNRILEPAIIGTRVSLNSTLYNDEDR